MAKAVMSMTISLGVRICMAYWNSLALPKLTSTSM